MSREIRLPITDILTSEWDGDGLREECGVVGISNVEGAAELTFLALYALQHRQIWLALIFGMLTYSNWQRSQGKRPTMF